MQQPGRHAARPSTSGTTAPAEPTSSEARWYVLWTRSRHERIVASALEHHGLPAFVPRVRRRLRTTRRTFFSEKNLFPGYVFVNALLDRACTTRILKTRGVVKLLGRDGQRSGEPVRPEFIDSIRLMCRDPNVRTHEYFPPGQTVRVHAGPLCGAIGHVIECEGTERLAISLELLGRSVSVQIDRTHLEPEPDWPL